MGTKHRHGTNVLGIKSFNYILTVQKARLFLHRGVSSLTGTAHSEQNASCQIGLWLNTNKSELAYHSCSYFHYLVIQPAQSPSSRPTCSNLIGNGRHQSSPQVPCFVYSVAGVRDSSPLPGLSSHLGFR